MGVRSMPYMKSSGKPQFAGLGLEVSGGGGGSYTLPTATASRLGGVKIGSGVNVSSDGTISVSGGGGGTFDFSTTEFATGHKWIDGKDIYGKVFSGLANYDSNSFHVTKSTGGITGDVLGVFGYMIKNGKHYSSNYWFETDADVAFHTQESASSATADIIIFYTKGE